MDIRKINDQSLEWAIFIVRWASALAVLGAIVSLAVAATTLDVRYLIQAGVFGGAGLVGLAVGWYWLGNAEWRREPRTLAGTPCGAHYQGLTCNVPVDAWGLHDGRHQDGVRDPEGAQLWS